MLLVNQVGVRVWIARLNGAPIASFWKEEERSTWPEVDLDSKANQAEVLLTVERGFVQEQVQLNRREEKKQRAKRQRCGLARETKRHGKAEKRKGNKEINTAKIKKNEQASKLAWLVISELWKQTSRRDADWVLWNWLSWLWKVNRSSELEQENGGRILSTSANVLVRFHSFLWVKNVEPKIVGKKTQLMVTWMRESAPVAPNRTVNSSGTANLLGKWRLACQRCFHQSRSRPDTYYSRRWHSEFDSMRLRVRSPYGNIVHNST